MGPAGRPTGSRYDASFIIRLWLERTDMPGPPEWRWHAQHVQSGQQIHCCFLADLLDFIERQAGVPAPRLLATSHDTEEAQ